MEFRVIQTQRGGQKAVHRDYLYTKTNSTATTTYWYCVKRDAYQCKGALKTTAALDHPQVTAAHNHQPDKRLVDLAEANTNIKRLARDTAAKPAAIRQTALEALPDDSRVMLGTKEAVRKLVGRVRTVDRPANIALPDLVIDGEWAATKQNPPERFLLTDNRDNNVNNRVILFASDPCLQLLSEAQRWFVDGNFAMSPPQFQQLYILRVPLGQTCVTAAFALLERKTEDAYRVLFEEIINACVQHNFGPPQPEVIHMDFEQPVIRAVRHLLPATRIQGCFYHLTQSTWRQIQTLGLRQRYMEDDEFKTFASMLDALAFLPVNDVQAGLRHLQAHVVNGAEPLIEYFDHYYVNGVFRAVQQPGAVVRLVRAHGPRFPPEYWNVHIATINGDARTNNMCESWNNRYVALTL